MTLAALCIFIIIIGMLWINKKRNGILEEGLVMRRILIRRWRLLWEVAKYHVNGFILAMVLAAFLCSVLLCVQRIDLATSLISFLVVIVYVSVMHIPVIVMLTDFYRQIAGVENFNAVFREKYLSYMGIGWGYIDQDWFICVDKGIACLLSASQIDFSKNAKYEMRTWSVIHGYAYERNLKLYTHDGKVLRVRIIPDPCLHEWIKNHGGRIIN